MMNIHEIRKLWEEFIFDDEFEKYFNDFDDMLMKIINYMTFEKKSPPKSDDNKEISVLGEWLSRQKSNYKSKKGLVYKEYKDKIKDILVQP